MHEGRNLVNDAVLEAKELRRAATEAAKNELIESMTPRVRQLVDGLLRESMKTEDTDRIRRGMDDNWPGESHTGFEEGKDKGDAKMDKDMKSGEGGEEKELDMESLFAMFPGLAEKLGVGDEEAPPEQHSDEGIAALGEGDAVEEGKKKDDEEEEKVDETIEISEEQLAKVCEAIDKAGRIAEVQVTKSFGEETKSGELEDVAKDVGKGLNPAKSGEHHWEEETPPAHQDYSVKEIRNIIAAGLSENRALRTKLVEAAKIITSLRTTLSEVNLFNSKVLHVQRIMNANSGLTKEQKVVVMESIDCAKTVAEVKTVAEAINKTLKSAGQIAEGRNPRRPSANAQRARTSAGADKEVLRESADRNQTGQYNRLRELAGLVK